MRVVGLFAGVGGLERGLADAGHETRLLCEVDPVAAGVLRNHFPDVEIVSDVVDDLRRLPPDTELVAAGFPCQDLSQAGRTQGIFGSRSGVVWRLFELLERKRAPWVLLENVYNMLHLHRGAGMRVLVKRLEAFGYRWAYRVLDSRSFGLAQRRLRVFVLASRERDPAPILLAPSRKRRWPEDRYVPGARAFGFYWTEGNTGIGWTRDAIPPLKSGSGIGIPSPPALWFPWRKAAEAFVVPSIEDAEHVQGFRRGWTSLESWQGSDRARWRLVGNAVSVPVAEWIGRRLQTVHAVESEVRRAAFPGRGWPDAAFGGPGREPAAVEATPWPVSQRLEAIDVAFKGAQPLSGRAAAGFFDRLDRSTLRVPVEFREALARYCTSRGFPRSPRKDRTLAVG